MRALEFLEDSDSNLEELSIDMHIPSQHKLLDISFQHKLLHNINKDITIFWGYL